MFVYAYFVLKYLIVYWIIPNCMLKNLVRTTPGLNAGSASVKKDGALANTGFVSQLTSLVLILAMALGPFSCHCIFHFCIGCLSSDYCT